MNVLRTLKHAKEEISIGSPAKAEAVLPHIAEQFRAYARGIEAAVTQLENGDPMEAESNVDLVIRNLEG